MKNTESRIGKKIITIVFTKSKENICHYLGVMHDQFKDILKNIVIYSEISGHNNQVCLIRCYSKKKLVGTLCLKYSFNKKGGAGLVLESNILKILRDGKTSVPEILGSGSLSKLDFTYVLMESIRGTRVTDLNLNKKEINEVISNIQEHEKILNNNWKKFKNQYISEELYKKINFEKKISVYMHDYLPDFNVLNSLNFLNKYLNSKEVISERRIVTDRSTENIFLKKENREIVFIDFSTVRIGTKFDNLIQFIDDPLANFSCSKEKLVDIFFKKNNLKHSDLKLYYATSVYTNLLQGIFTYKKNHKLGINYFRNANDSFMKLRNKKSVLVDLRHQHAL